MSEVEFQAWSSTPRLYRDCTITEKIDGTNACIVVSENAEVYAQSRKRLVTPEDDNFGFAKWVYNYENTLWYLLGPGYHYGEWYGQGIQRNYGLTEKRFALFNSNRWQPLADDGSLSQVPGLEVVPIIRVGAFGDQIVDGALDLLRWRGSVAVPGFLNPEGIVVWHHASRQKFKVTLENDEAPKSLVKAA